MTDSAVCPQHHHGLAHKEYIRWGRDRVIPTLLGILDEPILGCLDTEIHVTTIGYDLWHGEWYRWALTGFIMPEIEIFKGPRLPLPRLKGLVSRKKTGGRRHLPACRACLPSLSPLLWTSPNGSSVFDSFRSTGKVPAVVQSKSRATVGCK